MIQQQHDDLGTAKLCGGHQGRNAVYVAYVNVDANPQQRGYDLASVFLYGIEDRN